MAERTPILTDVAQVAEASGNEDGSGNIAARHSNIGDAPRKKAGPPDRGHEPQAGRRQHRSDRGADGHRARLGPASDQPHPANSGESRRRGDAGAGERALDRAQAAIWGQVLAGDYRAVMVFLQISQRRAKLNGLDAPTSIVISPNVRIEMERALAELQEITSTVTELTPTQN